jgi:hypothetical protein
MSKLWDHLLPLHQAVSTYGSHAMLMVNFWAQPYIGGTISNSFSSWRNFTRKS